MVLAVLAWTGCAPAASRPLAPEPSPSLVRAALEDTLEQAPPAPLVAPPEPSRLRPCCALGHDLAVKIGVVPLPWFHLETVRGPAGIGPHEYSPGLLQILPSPSRRPGQDPAREHNGIVYTCRGGFVDTAHVRDFADHAWFLAGRVAPLLVRGGTIELGDLGGRRQVVVQPVDAAVLRRVGARSLAVTLAARLSFELSVWREIATWYGYESVPPWPETISTFSLEDLYSNLLGTKIASGILRTTPIASRMDWDLAMNRWLPAALEALGIVPKAEGAAAFGRVEGRWWDGSRRIPDWKVTMQRRFDFAPVVEPLLIRAQSPQAGPHDDAPPGEAASSLPCGTDAQALPLRVPEHAGGVELARIARFEVVADRSLVREGLALPRGERRLDVRDFAAIIQNIEQDIEQDIEDETAPARVAIR